MKRNFDQELANLRVLVIDDMEAMRQMEVSCLKDIGVMQVVSANNGEQAWRLLQQQPVDLIICDWDMPQLNGLQLLKRVRQADRISHIPFIMVTANSEGALVKRAVVDGVSDYLVKPFQPRDLGYRVIKVLHQLKPAASPTV